MREIDLLLYHKLITVQDSNTDHPDWDPFNNVDFVVTRELQYGAINSYLTVIVECSLPDILNTLVQTYFETDGRIFVDKMTSSRSITDYIEWYINQRLNKSYIQDYQKRYMSYYGLYIDGFTVNVTNTGYTIDMNIHIIENRRRKY